jgi:hypothetical protein
VAPLSIPVVAYMRAVERRKQDFVPVEKMAGKAVALKPS